MCKITIIVPIYKVETYLRRCVDSILAQTFKDFECILVDDGSPDGCGEICDEYAKKDKRVQVIHKENGGVSDARNVGIDAAKGEYLYFVDADDYLDDCLLETVVKLLDGNNYEMVCFNFRMINVEGKTIYMSNFPGMEHRISSESEYLDFICDKFEFYIGWSPCTRVFKADIIKQHGLYFVDRKEIFAEDLLFVLEYLLYVNKIKVVRNVMYNYAMWEGSYTVNNKETRINEFVNLCAEFRRYLRIINKKMLLKKFHVLFYIIMDNRVSKSKFDEILKDMIKIDNKVFLRRNMVSGIIHSNEITEYIPRINRKALVYEYSQYYIHSGNTVLFKALRAVMNKRHKKDRMSGD